MESDLPAEMVDPDAPPGTPTAAHVAHSAAPVWCHHGVCWTPTGHGWVAADAMTGSHPGHDTPARDPGSIACQPTYASLKAWERLRLAREVIPDTPSESF